MGTKWEYLNVGASFLVWYIYVDYEPLFNRNYNHFFVLLQNVSEYDQEIPQSHTAGQSTVPLSRATWHQQSQDIRRTK